ncbi:DM13 domain-containing protein [Geodermatophilus sp. SYSU D00758]
MAVRRRTWIGSAALLLVAVGAFVLVWFQPQKLLYDTAVAEALPSAAGAAGAAGGGSVAEAREPVELARGTFVSHEHATTGSVRVLRLPDGQVVVRLEGLDTSNGPDLYVYLSATPADGDRATVDEEFVDLGRLKGNVGDQNYAVPAGVDPADWASVVIWCERFRASFGAADLTPAAAV